MKWKKWRMQGRRGSYKDDLRSSQSEDRNRTSVWLPYSNKASFTLFKHGSWHFYNRLVTSTSYFSSPEPKVMAYLMSQKYTSTFDSVDINLPLLVVPDPSRADCHLRYLLNSHWQSEWAWAKAFLPWAWRKINPDLSSSLQAGSGFPNSAHI